jgi:hypothetical protein
VSAWEWIIYGKGPGLPWEEVDRTDEHNSVGYLLAEYSLAFGTGWRWKTRRVRKGVTS